MNRSELLASLRVYGRENNVPNITDANADFLSDLIEKNNTQSLLEIGTANGYSSIVFGTVLERTGGQMISIDFSPKSHEMAVENIRAAGLESRVQLIFGNALDVIPTLEQSFDFVFIDGMKRRSKDFLELVWDQVPVGGVIVVDDVIKFGDKMVGFFEYVDSLGVSHEIHHIDEDDGVMVIYKN